MARVGGTELRNAREMVRKDVEVAAPELGHGHAVCTLLNGAVPGVYTKPAVHKEVPSGVRRLVPTRNRRDSYPAEKPRARAVAVRAGFLTCIPHGTRQSARVFGEIINKRANTCDPTGSPTDLAAPAMVPRGGGG